MIELEGHSQRHAGLPGAPSPGGVLRLDGVGDGAAVPAEGSTSPHRAMMILGSVRRCSALLSGVAPIRPSHSGQFGEMGEWLMPAVLKTASQRKLSRRFESYSLRQLT